MTPTNVFDPHAIIQWLAEQEWPCPGTTASETHTTASGVVVTTSGKHGVCGCASTERIAPFAALRVECTDEECQKTGGAVQWTGEPYYPPGMTAYAPHQDCKGRRWVPEPDVEKACWRVWEKLAVQTWDKDWHLMLAQATDMKEAVLRAAEAWVKEHKA